MRTLENASTFSEVVAALAAVCATASLFQRTNGMPGGVGARGTGSCFTGGNCQNGQRARPTASLLMGPFAVRADGVKPALRAP